MKIGGVTVSAPPLEGPLVLHREPEPIALWARALTNMDEFNKLCPVPEPPGKLTKDGWEPDTSDKGYLELLESHNRQRLAYMIIHTLEPSKIEWDTVKADNPKTWVNWEKDLQNAQLTHIEIQRVVQLVLDANSLNEDKLEKARQVFLHGRVQAQNGTCSRSTAPESSPSGEPASASA